MLSRQERRAFALIAAGFVCVGVWSWYLRNREENTFFAPTVYLAVSNAPLQVFAANHAIYIVPPDGSLWRWGSVNEAFATAVSPTKIPFGKRWRSIGASHDSAVGIASDGTLWRWGRFVDEDPQTRGRGYYYSDMAHQLSSETNWAHAHALGWIGVAVKSDGTLWGWGLNKFGTLGVEHDLKFLTGTPVQINSETDWVSAYSKGECIVGLKKNGTLWTWGKFGTGFVPKPTLATQETNWCELVNGSLARNNAGELWALQMHNPRPDTVISNYGYLMATNSFARTFAYGGLEESFMLYNIKPDGTLWARSHPVFSKPGKTNLNYRMGNRNDWVQLWNTSGTSFGLTADNTLWQWGHDLSINPSAVKPSGVARGKHELRRLFGKTTQLEPDRPLPPTIHNPRPLMRFNQGRRADPLTTSRSTGN